MTTDQPLDLNAIEAAARNAARIGSGIHPGTAIALVTEVRRLLDRVAELEEQQRREWQMSHARNPHTPLLCECGHTHFAHAVAAPHACFAYGKTCPCEAYRQLPHDKAVALAASRTAAACTAAANEDGAR